MDALDEQLAQLKLINSRPLSPRVISAGVEGCSSGSSNLLGPGGGGLSPKKVGPAVPPKPNKKSINAPQVPQSIIVKQTCEPLYSKRLQSDSLSNKTSTTAVTPVIIEKPLTGNGRSILHRKQPNYAVGQNHVYSNIKMTLDNPAILDQQLEALEHHKKQLEKKGLMPTSLSISTVPKLTSASFMNGGSLSAVGNSAKPSVDLNQQQQEHPPHHIYSNLSSQTQQHPNTSSLNRIRDNTDPDIIYSNIMHHQNNYGQINKPLILNNQPADMVYSNVGFGGNDELPPPPAPIEMITPPAPLNLADPSSIDFLNQISEDELPPPPSPVSSSYSELRRANDNFPKMPTYPMPQYGTIGVTCVANIGNNDTLNNSSLAGTVGGCNSSTSSINSGSSTVHPGNNDSLLSQQTYMNTSYNNDYSTYGGPTSQGSSTYESIYEPINPRPPSQLSSRSNYSLYTSYVNGPQTCSTGSRTPTMGNSASNSGIISGPGSVIGGAMHLSAPSTIPNHNNSINNNHKEAEVEALTDLLVHSMDSNSDVDSYGICVKCGDRVVGENSGCTAMDQIYHIACFTCIQCQINLQGKPFYELEDKPYCEEDYLNTLEKCSVCMKPILERILRATGKPYHPQCFTCVVCGNSLDGIPFTVDATNQNYCIEDFHKKFAPRCCVCRQPIMPEPGQEETVRVVALDRSFHFECYKCEDCGLLLSSEAEGRGCYPLDDHVLCKSCNAKRVQALTNRMTTEL